MNASRQQDATAPAHRMSQHYLLAAVNPNLNVPLSNSPTTTDPQRYPPHPRDAYYPGQGIDVSAISASVQRYIPSHSPPSHSPLASNTNASSSQSYNSTSTAYISLPAGVDPATVDYRTFYPYNPSEVKHRKRTTRPQLKLLEETFKRETKPNAALRKTLAAQLEMTPRGVQARLMKYCPRRLLC